jgi:hypothetical protein
MRGECPIADNCIVKQSEVLRLAEKRGYSLTMLEQLTGIKKETLSTYKDKPSRPASMMPFSAVIKLMRALPDDLAELLIEDSDYGLKPLFARDRDWLQLGERASSLSAKIHKFQRTGPGIDHREDRELCEELREFAADAEAMVTGERQVELAA